VACHRRLPSATISVMQHPFGFWFFYDGRDPA
jgi:hypothetical protein